MCTVSLGIRSTKSIGKAFRPLLGTSSCAVKFLAQQDISEELTASFLLCPLIYWELYHCSPNASAPFAHAYAQCYHANLLVVQVSQAV